MTDVVSDANGHPCAFRARPSELTRALAEIPDRVLLKAYKRAWDGKPPRRTANSLRRRIAQIHRAAERQSPTPMTVRLPLLDAARELGVSSRTLRRQIEDGTLEPKYLGRGARGLRILAVDVARDEPPTWRLIPHRLRPYPRVVS